LKDGSRNGASLSAGAQLRKLGGGTPLLGIWKDMGRRAKGMSISLAGGTAGEPGGGLVCQGLMC